MTVIYEHVTRQVARIIINRPSKRNAVDLNTFNLLRDAIRRFDQDESANVAVLAGAGGNFCSGYDLNEIVDSKTAMPRLQQIEKMLLPLGTRLSQRKPIVAAIEGHAAGFGYELALRCDFRVGERDSRMGFLNRRFAIPIMNGGSVILPQLTGWSRAVELVTTGKGQSADEALGYGLLTEIADVGCAQGKALNVARCLSKFDQTCLLNDFQSLIESSQQQYVMKTLDLERKRSLAQLRSCGPLEVAAKFLLGELCRHGNTDLGNSLKPESEVTL